MPALPFRSRYLRHDELTAQLRAWAEAHPGVARLRPLGRTPEGREIPLLTLGPEPDRARPAVWVNANVHASELCGSSVALAIAEDVLRLHTEAEAPQGLPAHVRDRLREVVFYVAPRISVDGAEQVLRDGRYVRSNPRDGRPESRCRWSSRDLDGDGLALLMRVRDEAGEFVESAEQPGLLVPRQLEDAGPFYKLYPEGVIEGWDGATVPDPHFLGEYGVDLNRNFPFSWAHEPLQAGAGAFPLSEPEARAVVEFSSAHPEVFAWLDLHTFGGCYIRPLGDGPDTKMDPYELALFKQLGAWGEQHGGYPTVSGFEQFTYSPETPLRGALAEWAHAQRGALALTCELWDLFNRLGMPRPKRFVDYYQSLTRDDLVRLARWDREHNQGRVLRPWKPVTHPQLGEVEVGGLDTRVGISNPPFELLDEVCRRQSAFFLRVAAMAPALQLSARAEALGERAHRIEIAVQNQGYLPTYVLPSAKALPWNEGVAVELRGSGALRVEPADARRELGHLEGWGRGQENGATAIYFLRSKGSVSRRTTSAVVRGSGELTVRAGSPRTGWVERKLTLG